MFNMVLGARQPLNKLQSKIQTYREYDEFLDDGRSIISDICEIMDDSSDIYFNVSGFGDDKWPVDCRFDLAVVIEQIPDIIRMIKTEDYNFSLDFYEQGLEREIEFIDCESYVTLICNSRTSWIPNPTKVEMDKKVVETIFYDLYKNFFCYSEVLCNELSKNSLLVEWMKV